MNRLQTRTFCVLAAGVIFLSGCPQAVGQSDRGTITGTVSDPAGAVIPGAAVTLKNVATGGLYETVSTATGNYTLPSLPAGRYTLTVAAAGFGNYTQEGIEVQVAQTARIDFALKVGATSESVTVNADAPLLRTENAEQSQTVSGDRVDELPLTLSGNNTYGARNPLAGLSLAPDTYQVVGTNFFFRTNGSTDTARFLLDGQDITTYGMFSEHLSESHPSVEALQEVTLQTSNFAAEYGQVQGGLINFTTRGGTNQFHGTAYDYAENEDLNAGLPFTNSGHGHLVRPRYRTNDYGFTVGGPVRLPKLYDGRNRTFFFFNFDQFRNRTGISGSATTVPTAAMRNGDFSGILTGRTLGTDTLGRPILENTIYDPASESVVNGQVVRNSFPGNIIPGSRLDPIALKIQSYIPLPTFPGIVNNFAIVDTKNSTTTIPSLKIDQLFGSKTKISFYMGEWINHVPKNTGDGLPWPVSTTRMYVTYTNTSRLTLDETITPTLLLHLGAGEMRYNHIDANPAITQNFDALAQLGLVGGLGNPTGFPAITGLNASQGGLVGINAPGSIGWTNATHDYDGKPTGVVGATLVKGNHTYKAGAEWWKDIWSANIYNTAGTYNFSANETALPYLQSATIGGGSIGFPYASFLLGGSDSASIKNISDPEVTKTGLGIYLQDTWKVTRKLTLDYGIRWDRQTGWHEIHSRDSSFSPFIANPAAGGLPGATAYEGYGPGKCNCSFTNTYELGVGPRLGVAYQIDKKTVLRGGWGIIYGQTPVLNYFNTATVGVGFNTLSFSNSSFGEPAVTFQTGLRYDPAVLFAATLNPGVKPEPGTINPPPSYLDPAGGRPTRLNQWNISLQRQIFQNLGIEAAYVGNRAAYVLGNNSEMPNALSPQALAARGLDLGNPTAISLLTSTFASGKPQAAGFQLPYPGFPTGLTLAQSLRPFPQFGSIGVQWAQRGDSWYDALQVKLTKRFSHGFEASGSFSWQKELDYGISTPNNVYNKAVNKTISEYSQPLVFVTGFTYRTPGITRSKIVAGVVRDWTVGGVLRYASGLPIMAPCAQNNLQTLLFQSPQNVTISAGPNSTACAAGTFMNRVQGQPLYLEDLNCHCIDPNKQFVLNNAAWSNPAAGQFGTSAAYYNDYRYQRRPGESLSFGRIFRIREAITAEVRIEVFNVFNRLQMPDPSSTNALATQTRNSQSVPNAGFGYINTTSVLASSLGNNTGLGGNPRQGQALVRFRF